MSGLPRLALLAVRGWFRYRFSWLHVGYGPLKRSSRPKNSAGPRNISGSLAAHTFPFLSAIQRYCAPCDFVPRSGLGIVPFCSTRPLQPACQSVMRSAWVVSAATLLVICLRGRVVRGVGRRLLFREQPGFA